MIELIFDIYIDFLWVLIGLQTIVTAIQMLMWKER